MFANNFGNFNNVECGLVYQFQCNCANILLKNVNSSHPKPLNFNGFNFGVFQNENANNIVNSCDFCTTKFANPKKLFYVPVPLTFVSVTASVVHAVAQVEITQIYSNKESRPIEVIYFFPLDSNGAVTHFQAEMDGRIVKGKVKAHEEAKGEYNKAVANNQTAFLGEENKPDIFTVSIGQLQPGSEVKVIIGYVTEVKNEPDTNSIRFFLPTTIAPRYTPQSDFKSKTFELSGINYGHFSPARMNIKVLVSLQGEVSSVKSPSHKITVENTGRISGKENWNSWAVKLDGYSTEMNRDFVLLIIPKEHSKPRLYSETIIEDGSTSTAVMAHFIPSFKLKDQKVELIVLIDRSGSMSGQKILMAQKALQLLTHSMPMDCYFNIIGFGTTHKALFRGINYADYIYSESKRYEEATLNEAIGYTNCLEADLGGTEILAPLKEIYERAPIPSYLRQIFVITDGEVSNTEQVIGLVKSNAHNTRVFALGIGASASHNLVEGIAQAGGGTCAFVDGDENIQKQALGQLKNALQPAMTDIKIEWKGIKTSDKVEPSPPTVNKSMTLMGYNKPIEPDNFASKSITTSFFQAPRKIPPVFDGSQLVIFGLFQNNKPTGATITAQSVDGPLVLNIEMSNENDVGSTKMLHRLAAIKIVRELELEEACQMSSSSLRFHLNIKQQIMKNGISSKYTSFVAVDEQRNVYECWGHLKATRQVPSQVPQNWNTSVPTMSLFGQQSPQNPFNFNHGQQTQIFSGASTGGIFGANLTSKPSAVPFSFAPSSNSFGGGAPSVFGTSSRITTLPSGDKVVSLLRPAGTIYSFGAPESSVSSAFSFNSPSTKTFNNNSTDQKNMFGSPLSNNVNYSANNNEHSLVESKTREINLKLVYNLISLQTFQGTYPLTSVLANIIGLDFNLLTEECKKNGWNETAWATALSIAFFKEILIEWKEYWELVVTKAEKWMEVNSLYKDAMTSAARFYVSLSKKI